MFAGGSIVPGSSDLTCSYTRTYGNMTVEPVVFRASRSR